MASGLSILLLLVCVSASDNGFPRCNCDDDNSLWSIESILECQRVSDFLIAVAYFSIPIELLYFVSCSNVPFKWVLFEFIAFIVLCGLTHLLNGWTYGPHPFQLMLALTVFKILTALVSCATAITLITLIPLLLKVKVREFMLKKKTRDLGREVGIIMRQKEAGMHVRMLTQEIRKSLDRHTILSTTLFELSETLGLQYCAVWMPNENKTEMILIHELKGRNYSHMYNFSIPINDSDVVHIKASDGVNILRPDSPLVHASGDSGEPGPVAAIRMPMLRVSNFKGGTPELIQTFMRYWFWSSLDLEIIKVVADQVAVALSHAAVLEESQLMREKLAEQNRALQQAKMNAMMASHARNSFQKVMSDGMRRPMHSILGLLSMMQDENLNNDQRVIIDAMVRTSNVLSTLINDVMDNSAKDSGRFPLEMRSFRLHALIKEAACLAKCLCVYKGFGLQLMWRNNGSQGRNDQRWAAWRHNSSDGDVYIKFEIAMTHSGSMSEGTIPAVQLVGRRYVSEGIDEGLSFTICKKLVQVLLTDDDDVNRAVTRRLLEKLGCIVTSVSSGLECLSTIGPAGTSIQIVFLDLHMPELDGFEVALRIRKFRSRTWPLIIGITASADEDVWDRCKRVASTELSENQCCCKGFANELRCVLQQANKGMT
ncbi:Signal transduction histidine kinase, hybrid-type, ethylene sensor [Prunus dulcis]|uniref:Signal transduction histidine kinase, hybrid-type, ethylene sensor n=1 Tax=Prunus dulcis TaxID=3755 RepID=A0A4Y1QKS2_PRUDU|nr:Signal transduction histidine kinase, hybrid-type, ethylene sensor [Prunus dulcis]